MLSKALQRAREYEKEYIPMMLYQQPRFHLTGGVGWINDPNGFAPYKGEYHLFYQYNPYETKWGPMHWGHVKTKDFIHWDRLPAAMAPDMDYDQNGCFSGGAVEMPDGRHLLMYTGVRILHENGKPVDYQTQCIAIGDGIEYEKYEGNPVIRAGQVPEGGSVNDFRDPHIWREDDIYWCVVGNRTEDTSGSILLYKSQDAINWEYVSRIASCHNQFGKMWECPDFFPLDGKHVLHVSPQEMKAKGLEFHPGNATVCIIGDYDRQTHHLKRENVQAIDYGLDFYAPQTLQTYDGRRVMIGWMQNWETANAHPQDIGIMGQMTIPRELSIIKGRLIQNPVRELETCRRNQTVCKNVLITGETSLQGISGRFLDMTVRIRPVSGDNMYQWFDINVAKDDDHYTKIHFEPASASLRIDRSYSGLAFDIVNVREVPVFVNKGELKVRILLDRYSLEIFVNDGEQAASSVIYTPLDAKKIDFNCDGKALIDVEKYDIEI